MTALAGEDVVALRPDARVCRLLVGTNDGWTYLTGGWSARGRRKAGLRLRGLGKEPTTAVCSTGPADESRPHLKILLCTPFAAPSGRDDEIASRGLLEMGGHLFIPLRPGGSSCWRGAVRSSERIAADYGTLHATPSSPFHRLIADFSSLKLCRTATQILGGINPPLHTTCHRRHRIIADCWIEAAARVNVD